MSWNIYLLFERSTRYFTKLDRGTEVARRINSFLEVKNIILRLPVDYRLFGFSPFPGRYFLQQKFKRSCLIVINAKHSIKVLKKTC